MPRPHSAQGDTASAQPWTPGRDRQLSWAGWQVLMTAALWPELFGPIIVAGAPVSYWAGDNPMRYAGGLPGGSWLTALTGDVGAGRFDGAWLVENFENLDPANTLWSKQHHLYANIDTEAERHRLREIPGRPTALLNAGACPSSDPR